MARSAEVAGLGDLPVHEVLVELLAPQGQLVAPPLQGLVDPDQVSEELALLAEVGTEHAVREAAEPAR